MPAVDVPAKWSTATLKAPWFDDETVAGDRSDAVDAAALDNDIKEAPRAAIAPRAPFVDVPSWSTSESSH